MTFSGKMQQSSKKLNQSHRLHPNVTLSGSIGRSKEISQQKINSGLIYIGNDNRAIPDISSIMPLRGYGDKSEPHTRCKW